MDGMGKNKLYHYDPPFQQLNTKKQVWSYSWTLKYGGSRSTKKTLMGDKFLGAPTIKYALKRPCAAWTYKTLLQWVLIKFNDPVYQATCPSQYDLQEKRRCSIPIHPCASVYMNDINDWLLVPGNGILGLCSQWLAKSIAWQCSNRIPNHRHEVGLNNTALTSWMKVTCDWYTKCLYLVHAYLQYKYIYIYIYTHL